MLSLWEDRNDLPRYTALEEDIQTDVLVIGGGMAGILCAHFLKEAGVRYALVEAGRICQGTTGHTTAKITAQHGLIYEKLVSDWGEELAGMYLRANLRAVEAYRELCGKIGCGFENADHYVYSRNAQGKLERELKALEKLHYPASFADALGLPFSVVGAVRFAGQAQFDPLAFVKGIAAELNIYENTRIVSVKDNAVMTARGKKITAEKLIFTTHFPIVNTHGFYFVKMYQQRSYVIALAQAQQVKGMFIDEAQNGLSFRNAGELLLLGGGGHRTGKGGGCWQELRDFAGKYYPKAREQYNWAAQDCMTLDRVPYIGRYAGRGQEWYVATGFNKWGMTSAMAAAQILRDYVLERENPFAPVFSPSRRMLKPQLAANMMEAAADLMAFSVKRCPHMGCALKWNSAEHSWDCPCHGSRFSQDGVLLEDPATGDSQGKWAKKEREKTRDETEKQDSSEGEEHDKAGSQRY